METKEYLFYSTFYDKELLRQTVILLKDENIDFKLDDRSNLNSSRAPLSAYIEVDVLISEADLEKAEKLLQEEGL